MTSATGTCRAARDLLQNLATDDTSAVAEFSWPLWESTTSGKIRRVDLRGREEQAAEGETAVDEYRDEQFPELRR